MTPATPARPAGRLERGFAAIERVAIAIGAVAILATAGLICATIVGRAVFARGVPDAEIIVRDLMVVALLVPLAAVAGRRAHIAIDLFVRRLAPATRRTIGTITGVASLAFLLPILASAWQNLATAWRRDSYWDGALEIPEWPGRAIFLAGFALFVARSIHRLFTDARDDAAAPPDRGGAAGPRTPGDAAGPDGRS